MFKVMTLNLWGYHEWDKRTENLVSLVNQEAPDCIALQEVLTNHAFSNFPSSDFIANNCGYKHRVFAPTYPRNNSKDREGNRTQRASYGQAFLSQHPIVSSESYFLRLYPEHPEENTVLFCSVDIDGTIVDFANVHFANSSKFSDLHLRELMELLEKRQSQPIILGDFNVWRRDMAAYKETVLKGFASSSEVAEYISSPADNDSLDYIVMPESKYKLNAVHCPDIFVSDHKALLASIVPQ